MPTLGRNCKLYIGTAGSQAATLVLGVIDVKVNQSRETIDGTTRDSGEYIESSPGMLDREIEAKILYKAGSAPQETIRDAFLAGTPIAVLALTGLVATVGSEGPDGDFMVSEFPRDETLKDNVTYTVKFKPTPSTRVQTWTEISS